jgi:hypothetical protein
LTRNACNLKVELMNSGKSLFIFKENVV